MDLTRHDKNRGDTVSVEASLIISTETWHVLWEDWWWEVFVGGVWLEIRPGVFQLEQYCERLGKRR